MEDAGGPRSGRGEGTTRAILRGRPGRAVLASSVRTFRQLPQFVASTVGRRDRRTWVFGNIHGFRDSPRYLAEHVLHSFPRIRPVWIANSDTEAAVAAAAGLDVALRARPEGTRSQRRAGVAFFSHGFRDLDLPLVAGAYLVWLWHGKSLKRVGLDVSEVQARRRPVSVRVAARLVRSLQARAYGRIGMFVASSQHDRQRFISAFAARPARVKLLGSPRFDVIRGGPEYRRAVGGTDDLPTRLGYAADDHIVLWLPTHRIEYGGDAAWLPELSSEVVDEQLGSTNIKLLVKPHPNADFAIYRQRLPGHPQVRLLADGDVDVNCLMHIAAALVSDYSSAVFDYAILGRPIHFLAPDIETYDDQRGLYEPYETLTGGLHRRDWATLLRDLRADVEGSDGAVGAQNTRRVREYCGHNLEPDSCRRISEAIIAAVLANGQVAA